MRNGRSSCVHVARQLRNVISACLALAIQEPGNKKEQVLR